METSVPSSMDTPLQVSFSVAKGVGIFGPFQSKVPARMASEKSALGSQSVHWRCPWKPPATALRPSASSCQPSSSSFGLPYRMSRITIVILVINSQSLSAGTTLDLVMTSGRFLPALQSKPSRQLAFTQASARSYSSAS